MTPVNDWEIKKSLALSLAILLVLVGLAGIAVLGFDVPVLRQIIGFVLLTFIPGVLILRILRIHNIGIIESLAYSVGLSLAFVMFSGALINFVLPFIGISRPISLLPVTASLALLIAIMTAVAYVRDKDFVSSKKTTPEKKLQLPAVLLLVLLLLLAILGATLVDAFQNNILLIILILAIAAVVGLAAFGKFIQPQVYPLAVFIISICLLYQTTLMSPYLVGSDIYTEYHFYRIVAYTGFWDASIPDPVNSCLSITILAPVYSLLLNVDGIWMFKAIYPLIFALMPLILFHVFSQQMSQKKAFLSVFFFVAVPTFSLEMIALCRQQVAELFFALIILLLVDRKLNLGPKLTLAAIFAASIVVSHYSLGFIGFIYMGLFLPVVFIIKSDIFRKAWGWLTAKLGGLPESLTSARALPAKVLIAVVAIYFVVGSAWYGIVASGINLKVIRGLAGTYTDITTTSLGQLVPQPTQPAQPTQPIAFLDFGHRDALVQTALGLDFSQASPQGKVFRVLQYITELFLIAGCIRLIFRPKGLRFTAEYIALSTTSVLIILACIFLPGFAEALNTTRMYHIALIMLAPFCILGGEAIWLGISSLWHRIGRKVREASAINAEDNQGYLKFVATALLIPYFLFTSGFIYEATGQDVTDRIDTPYSIALSSYRVNLTSIFYWQDGAAARWLTQRADTDTKVYVDMHSGSLLWLYDFPGNLIALPQDASKIAEDDYMFLTTWNINKKEATFAISPGPGLRHNVSFNRIPGLSTAIEGKNKIYDNGGAQILVSDNQEGL
jgi:uncharacterized membrane protein